MTLDKLFENFFIEVDSDFKVITQEKPFHSQDITKKFEKNDFGYFTERTISKLPYYRVHNVTYGKDGLEIYVSMVH